MKVGNYESDNYESGFGGLGKGGGSGLQPETMKVVKYESATMKVTIGGGQGDFLLQQGGFRILRRLCELKAIGIATVKVGIGLWAGGGGSCHSAETMKVGNYESDNYESGFGGLGKGGGGGLASSRKL